MDDETREPPKPMFADYLARRERALDFMAWWLANPKIELPNPQPCRTALALWCARYGLHNWRARLPGAPPPRDRTPLPLP